MQKKKSNHSVSPTSVSKVRRGQRGQKQKQGTLKNKKFVLSGTNLDLDSLCELSQAEVGQYLLTLSSGAKRLIKKSNDFVKKICETDATVYGINTGFGALSETKIPRSDLCELQENLLRSHCAGVGPALPVALARAMIILRINCLLRGNSGISPHVVEMLLNFYNLGITPVIPLKGSVGASGDLAPLAHLALPLLGEGEVFFKSKEMSAAKALKLCGLKKVELGPKDGLALINGTTLMTAMAAFAVHWGKKLATLCDVACALSLEGIKGTPKAFDARIAKLKPHPGQIESARNLTLLLQGSQIVHSHSECGKVQDPYSFRCAPQVHGASRQTIAHLESVVTTEINAVTDNPLIFVEDNEVISGGNFHGEALALSMDYLALGMAELCSISERRIEKLTNAQFSGLPPFLVKKTGLNSGLMIAHVTSACLVSENKILCHPASVDSVPTSADKEDHVSMGPNAGTKLFTIIENLKYCLAIEFLCNTQAIEFLRPLQSSQALESVYQVIRKSGVAPIERDRNFSLDIKKIVQLIENDHILNAVQHLRGGLK